ncbi:DUF6361 family protein [Micromonospora sp. NPDC004704]
MVSHLTWLDNSRDDQRRIRELLGMFSDTESRDELGVGQVRDALSDLLFPGTSTLHTRARYLLIVPWCYQEGERRGLHGDALSSRVSDTERRVIAGLLKAGATDGMIGRIAGVRVRNLPSVIYASALNRFGIRTAKDGVAPLTGRFSATSEADELTDRRRGDWHPTLPPPPMGFPSNVEGGLELLPAEARWLRERVLATASDTLLAHLLAPDHRPEPNSSGPWNDPAAVDAPELAASNLRHAERFSLAMHGAALLYNLLIAERYEQAGFDEHVDPVGRYREALAGWGETVANWSWSRSDRAAMWAAVIGQNPRVSTNASARRFIDRWLDALMLESGSDVADHERLRRLVAEREQSVKRAQSRLVNQKLLRSWSGASGTRRLAFRWPQVRRMVADIHDGWHADRTEMTHAGT